MNTNFKQCKAAVINPYIALKRTPKPNVPGVFELDIESICKLTDALSRGNIIDFIAWDPESDAANAACSLSAICEYLFTELKDRSKNELFGTLFGDAEDMYQYVLGSTVVESIESAGKDITAFVKSKYALGDNGFERIDSKYRNY